MTRQELERAGERLDAAAESASDPDSTERLRDLAGQLHRLADADHGPDHGRLARIQSGLDEIQAAVGDDAAVRIEESLDAIRAFRETVEGV